MLPLSLATCSVKSAAACRSTIVSTPTLADALSRVMTCDVIVIGGGPAGLAVVRALAGSGLSVTMVERQPHHAFAVPVDDGDRTALSHELTRRSDARLGKMHVVGGPHVYPLATMWSDHFAARRAALIGDAAVGMHPVTAHGFNLGLASAAALAALVRRAGTRGRDIAAPALLRRYEAAHRLAAGRCSPLPARSFASTPTIACRRGSPVPRCSASPPPFFPARAACNAC